MEIYTYFKVKCKIASILFNCYLIYTIKHSHFYALKIFNTTWNSMNKLVQLNIGSTIQLFLQFRMVRIGIYHFPFWIEFLLRTFLYRQFAFQFENKSCNVTTYREKLFVRKWKWTELQWSYNFHIFPISLAWNSLVCSYYPMA